MSDTPIDPRIAQITAVPEDDYEALKYHVGTLPFEAPDIIADSLVVPDSSPYSFIRGLIDIRAKLPRRWPNGGYPNTKVSLGQKNGVIIHYSGPPVNLSASDFQIIYNEASYHVGKDWGGGAVGDGYMYHIAIGRDGSKFLCRDLESMLYHAGVYEVNRDCISIHLPLGTGQMATPAAIRAAVEVLEDIRAWKRSSRSGVRGHLEVSATACPDQLMGQIVRPYRAGTLQTTPPPVKTILPFNFIYHEDAAWARERAEFSVTAINTAAGENIAQAISGREKVGYVADYCLAYPTAKKFVAVLVGDRVREYTSDAVEFAMRQYPKKECDVWDGLTDEGMRDCLRTISARRGLVGRNVIKAYEEKFGLDSPNTKPPTEGDKAKWEIPPLADPTVDALVTRAGVDVGAYAPKGLPR